MPENSTKVVRKPPWLKIRIATNDAYREVRGALAKRSLHTVCEEARCPNVHECWNSGTATFMILGGTCTRACGFCAVTSGKPDALADRNRTSADRMSPRLPVVATNGVTGSAEMRKLRSAPMPPSPVPSAILTALPVA